ncbi:MAG: NYN domain-containing protein [Clostridia bacterium]|nr:NYN domain-containing protein [Clostridia bacterium]
METTDNSIYYQSVQKTISLTVAYLIGTKMELLTTHNPDYLELFDKLEKNDSAVVIRSLCNIRSNLMLNYTDTERSIVYGLKNLDKLDLFKDDIAVLNKREVYIIKANYKVNKYLYDISALINQKIQLVKDLFPEWVNWNYIKSLFVIPKIQNEKNIIAESNKYSHNRFIYPYSRYIYWNPSDEGNILLNDVRFLKVLYRQFKDEFNDTSKVKDASESVKTNIYDFIKNSKSCVIVVDCENCDAYKFVSVLKQLDQEEISRIHKIMLYDDIHTTRAWSYVNKITDIPVEYILVDRIKENKSLVDMRICAGVSASYYRDDISSFILCSSDSDFWGLISSLPKADFLVMIEYSKSGPDIKNALINNGTFYCFIDDFCTGNIKQFKTALLRTELKERVSDTIALDTKQLAEDIYTALRIELTDSEKKSFYQKFIQGLSLCIDKDGIMKIKIPEI